MPVPMPVPGSFRTAELVDRSHWPSFAGVRAWIHAVATASPPRIVTAEETKALGRRLFNEKLGGQGGRWDSIVDATGIRTRHVVRALGR